MNIAPLDLSRNFDRFGMVLEHFERIFDDFDRFGTFLSKAIAHLGIERSELEHCTKQHAAQFVHTFSARQLYGLFY